ncbi:MAG: DUF4345 family protein [Schlesneria sp.]
MVKIFLALVGFAYIGLAGWCSLQPEKTAKGVGFSLQPGSGQSEFLVVYGGLELALGLIFLWPLYRPEESAFPLFACLVIHACLVLFRTISFFLYSGIESTTTYLAATEWLIFLGSAYFFLRKV